MGGKPYCSSLVCSLASGFNNQKFTKTWSTFSCHVWFLWFLWFLFPISSSKCWCTLYGLLQKYLWKHVNQLCLHSPNCYHVVQNIGVLWVPITIQRFSRVEPRGRGREWATLGVHPLSWLLSNNRLEEVCSTLTTGTFSSRLLLSNQDKGCTPSVAHSLPLPLGPALLNLSNVTVQKDTILLILQSNFLIFSLAKNWIF